MWQRFKQTLLIIFTWPRHQKRLCHFMKKAPKLCKWSERMREKLHHLCRAENFLLLYLSECTGHVYSDLWTWSFFGNDDQASDEVQAIILKVFWWKKMNQSSGAKVFRKFWWTWCESLGMWTKILQKYLCSISSINLKISGSKKVIRNRNIYEAGKWRSLHSTKIHPWDKYFPGTSNLTQTYFWTVWSRNVWQLRSSSRSVKS